MTYYPTKVDLLPDYYFVSRLTENDKYADQARLGDRKLLVLFSPQNHFMFATYDRKDRNPNVFKNVPVSGYFESTWTFLYFSMSEKKQ